MILSSSPLDVAQFGRASALGAEGREFESRRPDNFLEKQKKHPNHETGWGAFGYGADRRSGELVVGETLRPVITIVINVVQVNGMPRQHHHPGDSAQQR